MLAEHAVSTSIKNENESNEVYLTIDEGFSPQDFIEIASEKDSIGCGDRLVIQLQPNFFKKANVEGKGRVSVMKAIIDIHPFLKPGSIVNVRKLGADEMSKVDGSNFAHRLDITFKDQNVSRRDMFQLAQSMNMQTVYRGKTIEFEGIRARIR